MTYFAYQGLLNATQMVYSVSFIPIYVASTFLGTYLFHKALKTRADLIKKFSLWFLLVVGVVTLVM